MATYECLKNNSFLLNKVAILTRPFWQPLVILVSIKNKIIEYTIRTRKMGGKLWKIILFKKHL